LEDNTKHEYDIYELLALLFTSESVTEGHPDKLCDQISDAVWTPAWSRTLISRGGLRNCHQNRFCDLLGEITTRTMSILMTWCAR
jgi:S-adenosylmethionine synthetase